MEWLIPYLNTRLGFGVDFKEGDLIEVITPYLAAYVTHGNIYEVFRTEHNQIIIICDRYHTLGLFKSEYKMFDIHKRIVRNNFTHQFNKLLD